MSGSEVREIARLKTSDGQRPDVCPNSDRALLETTASKSLPCDMLMTSERPGDVLTDVVLRLTFDNTAYLEDTCDEAEASGLLPDNLRVHIHPFFGLSDF